MSTSNQAPRKSGAPNPAPRGARGERAPVAPPPPAARSGKVTVSPVRTSAGAKRRNGPRLGTRDLALIALGIVGVLAVAFLLINNASDPTKTFSSRLANAQPMPTGVPAPDFTLPATDGKTYSLSQFRGKVVLLEFMAPWCPHCQADAPILNEVYDAYKDKNIAFVGVNASPYGREYEQTGDERAITIDDQKWFAETYKLQYPLLFDKSLDQAVVYGVTSYPTIFILDTKGNIVAKPATPITADTIKAALDKGLAVK